MSIRGRTSIVAARSLVLSWTVVALLFVVSGTSRRNPLPTRGEAPMASTVPVTDRAASRFADESFLPVAMTLPPGTYLAVSSEGGFGRVVVPGTAQAPEVADMRGFEIRSGRVSWYLIRQGDAESITHAVSQPVAKSTSERPYLNRKFDFTLYERDLSPLDRTASQVRIDARR
jgi:hypothetical protein